MYIFLTITGMWWLCVEQLSHNTRPCCRIPQLPPPSPPPTSGNLCKVPSIAIAHLQKERSSPSPYLYYRIEFETKKLFRVKIEFLAESAKFLYTFPGENLFFSSRVLNLRDGVVKILYKIGRFLNFLYCYRSSLVEC